MYTPFAYWKIEAQREKLHVYIELRKLIFVASSFSGISSTTMSRCDTGQYIKYAK